MERRLGRGLESLLSGSVLDENSGSLGGQEEISLAEVMPNPKQPRLEFNDAQLEELKDSIVMHGVLQPVCVRRVRSGYELISGERRCRASRLAGLQTIPAVIRENVSDEEMLELALIENIQRQDLDPLERARAYRDMMEGLGIKAEDVAKRVGLKRSTVANHVRLLDLPEQAQEALTRGMITMGHARALLGLQDSTAKLDLLGKVIRKELSVRKTEAMVREALSASAGGQTSSADEKGVGSGGKPPWAKTLEARLEEALGTRVEIRNCRGVKGQVIIHYHSSDELNGICERVAPQPEL